MGVLYFAAKKRKLMQDYKTFTTKKPTFTLEGKLSLLWVYVIAEYVAINEGHRCTFYMSGFSDVPHMARQEMIDLCN